MKLLSPVGNFESLRMAIFNGADEIYLGVTDFNARNNIEGFSLDDLDDVVYFAHLHGAKVNLTVNILFRDDELKSAVDLVVKAFNKGVDYFIVQDLGLALLLRQNYPQIILHASTQMAIHNLAGAKYVEKLGFSRVVLARETPLEEIKNIRKNTNLEIEYFCQGALCVCFSGNCYLSSYLCDASGNRGKCKQLCRLEYSLLKDGKTLKKGYLLSAKDLNMSARLNDLKNAGVDVLKIEGRARRPYYVAVATRQYRNALDGKKFDQNEMKLAYNRGYVEGYFGGNGNIISNFNNHIGVKIGKVTKVNRGKKFNEIVFSSNRPLSAKSAIKLFNEEKEVSSISLYDLKEIGENLYKTTTTQNAEVGNFVNLILDFDKEKAALDFVQKKDILIKVSAFSGKQICAEVSFDGFDFEGFGSVLTAAQKQPLTKLDLENCFNKNDHFSVEIDFETDGVFLAKSQLNEFRRNFFESLKTAFLKKDKHDLKLKDIDIGGEVKIFGDFEFVEDENQRLTAKNIVYSPEIYDEQNILDFKKRCENFGKSFYLDLPNFALDKDIEFLKKLVETNKLAVVANNSYALEFDCKKVAGGALNVYNSAAAKLLNVPIICAEDSLAEKTKFAYMTLRHCPFKSDLGATCAKCPYGDGYTLKMQNGKALKIKRKKLSTCTFYLTD